MNEIAKKLNKYFMESEMSYAELAKRTGIPKSALQRYIVGQTDKIPIDRLQSIAEALGTSAAVLMGWEEDETPSPTPAWVSSFLLRFLIARRRRDHVAVRGVGNYPVHFAVPAE